MKTTHCKHCGHLLDSNTSVNSDRNDPTEGDFTICFYCLTPYVFDDKLEMLPLEGEVLNKIAKEHPERLGELIGVLAKMFELKNRDV